MKQKKYIKPYREIEINTDEIEQSLLNIDNKVRANLFNWNGQFSPQFVEAILNKYANEKSVVYDPFLGSGTTLYECSRKNISAFGMELNPSAYYMSKVYELANINLEQRKNIVNQIDLIVTKILNTEELLDTIKNSIDQNNDNNIKNILSLLIILMDIYKNEISLELLYCKWEKLKNIIYELPYSANSIGVFLGDARYSKIEDNSIDLIFTSPPYINVFNYHQNYRRSVEALGFDVLRIAKNEFGSNRKNRGNRFLTIIQYCIDMALTIRELIRIGKDKSRFILVVGRESNVLSLSFSNSELIYNICCEVFGLKFLIKQQRVFKNRYGRMIYEDILHFENSKVLYDLLDEVTIINKSRQIAKDMLQDKLGQVSEEYKDYDLLVSAINKAEQVNKSEV